MANLEGEGEQTQTVRPAASMPNNDTHITQTSQPSVACTIPRSVPRTPSNRSTSTHSPISIDSAIPPFLRAVASDDHPHSSVHTSNPRKSSSQSSSPNHALSHPRTHPRLIQFPAMSYAVTRTQYSIPCSQCHQAHVRAARGILSPRSLAPRGRLKCSGLMVTREGTGSIK